MSTPSAPHRHELLRDLPQVARTEVSKVRLGEPISAAIRLLLARPESRMVYVVDAQDRLQGVISWRCVLRVAKARMGIQGSNFLSLFSLARDLAPETVDHLMRRPTTVTMDTPLWQAIVLMEDTQQNDLPIVDAEGRVVGEANGMAIMRVALQVFEQTERDVEAARRDPPPR